MVSRTTKKILALILLGCVLTALAGCDCTDPRNYDDQQAIPWNSPLREEKEFDMNPTFNW